MMIRRLFANLIQNSNAGLTIEHRIVLFNMSTQKISEQDLHSEESGKKITRSGVKRKLTDTKSVEKSTKQRSKRTAYIKNEQDLKKESKTKKKTSNTDGESSKAVQGNQLILPAVVIPTELERTPRPEGPSPWNGTIKYTNQVYFGAHISAAGWKN